MDMNRKYEKKRESLQSFLSFQELREATGRGGRVCQDRDGKCHSSEKWFLSGENVV